MNNKDAMQYANQWFASRGWTAFAFQKKTWKAYLQGKNGIVNAPTGSGKTYSLLIPAVLGAVKLKKDKTLGTTLEPTAKGLRLIWITPIRALAKEIAQSAQKFLEENNLEWQIGIRTGDTSTAERQKQKKKVPQILITTPESLHLLLASKDAYKFFDGVEGVVADEWHELVGSKRGVQVELAFARLKYWFPKMRVWGISATIGNMEEACQVLLGHHSFLNSEIIRAKIDKKIVVQTILPQEIEKYPWAGHLGIQLLPNVLEYVDKSQSTLIFTNTRAQAEIWYQRILDVRPDLAGLMAMHHGSISKELREWVEEALYTNKLDAVVCTSSLDLGVDFRPVETIVQIGGPKGVSRFIQRAGRSGHRPGATSTIIFAPTNSFELLEAAALRQAIKENKLERRVPYVLSFDVLVQYLMTLAVGDGFEPAQVLAEIQTTFSFCEISEKEWEWVLLFLTTGGKSLDAYDEYKKVEVVDGRFKVANRRIAMRHRMSIGTITGDNMMQVKFVSGGYIGSVEEWFASQLSPGDTFWFSGRNLELVRIKEMTLQVKKSKKKTGKIPSWQGGRLSFTSHMSDMLRRKLTEAMTGKTREPELKALAPLLDTQSEKSHVPLEDEFLIEQIQTKEGYHVFMYPFEGRLVHEGMASLIAYRMSLLMPISFSMAFNDYGFELLSDQPIPLTEALDNDFFTSDHLLVDIQAGINSAELAKRKFRDIATISGLIFRGYPGSQVKDRHLQSNSSLIYDVFDDYDPDNLLLRQAMDEVVEYQLEFGRMKKALQRINAQKLVITYPNGPTPFSFPIMVDRLRAKLTSESIEDRIKKMKLDAIS